MQVSAGGVYDIGLHVVWCAKYRRQVLTGTVGVRLRELIDAKAAEHGWRIVTCQIMPDHVHLFVKTTPKDSPAFVANQFKGPTDRRAAGPRPEETRICEPAPRTGEGRRGAPPYPCPAR